MSDEIGNDEDDTLEQSDLDLLDTEAEKLEEEEADEPEGDEPKEEDEKAEDDEEENELEEAGSIFERIKEVAPEIYKQIPELRPIIALQRQYAEVFTTPEDAKEAKQNVEAFQELAESIVNGDPSKLFKELADNNEEGYVNFTKAILPTILKGHPEMYYQIVLPEVKGILHRVQESVKNAAKDSADEQVKFAVAILGEKLFKSKELNAPEPFKAPVRTERNEDTRQIESFENVTSQEIAKKLESVIGKRIDPNGAFPERQRKAIVNDIMAECAKVASKDTVYRANIAKLRKQAQQEGFTVEARERIITATLARVKPILPLVSQKIVAGYTKQSKVNKVEKKHIPASGSSGKSSGRKLPTDKAALRKMTDEEILDA